MDITAAANSIFGSPTVDSIFSSGQGVSNTADQQSAKAIITGHKREINRIRGYKEQLTPRDNKRLNEIATRIREITTRATAGTARQDELDENGELRREADIIIGKPTVDLEIDEKLAEYNNLKLSLLEPELSPALAKRVAFLERYKSGLEEQINENPNRITLKLQFQSAAGLIDQLKPLRLTTELSRREGKSYDDIVGLINEHVGVKVELTVEESNKVIALERSITQFQGSLGPDLSQQPTPQAVANAYVSLSR